MFFLHRERGQGLIEYALILSFAIVVVVVIVTILGPQVGNMYSRITGGFT